MCANVPFVYETSVNVYTPEGVSSFVGGSGGRGLPVDADCLSSRAGADFATGKI